VELASDHAELESLGECTISECLGECTILIAVEAAELVEAVVEAVEAVALVAFDALVALTVWVHQQCRSSELLEVDVSLPLSHN